MLNVSPFLQQLPADLQQKTAESITQLDATLTPTQRIILDKPAINRSLVKVFCCSQFVTDSCLREPALLIDLIQSEALFSNQYQKSYQASLSKYPFKDEQQLMRALRLFRRREMIRIAWRDLADWATLDETLHDLTALAEVCIQTALDFLYQQACQRFSIPLSAQNTPLNIIVLGMGKLGAWELNYSSDIDLIFAYAEDGVLNDRKRTHYSEFFARLCRRLVKVLDTVTADGFVFRTDVRLRPFGDSGPIVMNFDGMENYYLTQAREWERYAMIKARPVAGDFAKSKHLMAMLKPFVYRRYLDYGAFEELRILKAQISQELDHQQSLNNIKLGFGGIREIEFIGQAFQLIRGGQEAGLQQRGILPILKHLAELQLLTQDNAQQLSKAYSFLRRVENHIQQYQDRQTHELPRNNKEQQILAYSLGFANWVVFLNALNVIRHQVQHDFEAIFSLSTATKEPEISELLWLGNLDTNDFSSLGFQAIDQVAKQLQAFKNTCAIKRLTTKGAKILDALMPKLIETVSHSGHRDETLKRLLTLFEAVAGRNVYLALLAENPPALKQLVTLSAASAWVCDYLARYPILFDELLDTRSLYEPLTKQRLQQQLQQQLAKVNREDEEQVMIELRQFKHLNVLRVAAADIMEKIAVNIVSDYLTFIAEAIIDYVLTYSVSILIAKHGFPVHTNEKTLKFAILGFGKLGGIELGYGSDLDMVFLYDCEQGHQLTTGKKPITNIQFYGRLGQKIRHILDTNMLSGQLYEVDMRLRPSGHSGLLVSHIQVYEDYFKTQAWTWEHQALIRGRFIAGDHALQVDYQAIRQRILSLPRETVTLKQAVGDMREKMRQTLATNSKGEFDLKQSRGGLVDIEFMVQFGVLAYSSNNPTLTTYTDNIRLIQALTSHGFFTNIQAQQLVSIYCDYRDYGHRQVLQGRKTIVKASIFAKQQKVVENIWLIVMK
jgi:glutamate-ammonia-ligase adenylyltransferase